MSTDLTLGTDKPPAPIRFVLVNNRVPRTDHRCALCGSPIEKSYVRDSRTRAICCGVQCFAGWAHNVASIAKKTWKEGVMKCSNPDCKRGIGLVAYRRGWFTKRRYCSKHCRNAFAADAPKLQEGSMTTYFEWPLFAVD